MNGEEMSDRHKEKLKKITDHIEELKVRNIEREKNKKNFHSPHGVLKRCNYCNHLYVRFGNRCPKCGMIIENEN